MSRRWNVATSQRHDAGTLQRHDIGTSQRHDARTSRRCYWVFNSSSLNFQKAPEKHLMHLQCTQDPRIRYRAIMHLLINKIELKRSKNADMT